jgi:hypothetical protein
MTPGNCSKSSAATTGQAKVDQTPRYDRSVYSRKLKVRRPAKQRRKPRFL